MAKPKDKKVPKPEEISLGSGMAETAKTAKVARNKRNTDALAQAMGALQIKEVNPEKKFNSQYQKGGKK